jgi:hypothetical protein
MVPHRPVLSAPPRRAAVLAAVSVSTLIVVLGAAMVLVPAAGAQDRAGDGVSDAAQLPAQLGRPAVTDARKWTEVGLAVPVLLSFTAVLLCVGVVLLWRACRTQSSSAA